MGDSLRRSHAREVAPCDRRFTENAKSITGYIDMSKTCIICGGPAGSGEHVFPASLGGRRTNKGIYCKKHDNGYGSLVGGLAEQMAFFNSRLGVILDHSKEVKSIITTDEHSGQKVRLSVFLHPSSLLRESFGLSVLISMMFICFNCSLLKP